MKKLILLGYTENGKEKAKLFNYWYEFHKFCFSPEIEQEEIIIFEVTGNNYKTRQNQVLEIAAKYLNFPMRYQMNYDDLKTIESYFKEKGKQYGLTKKLFKMCIC